MEGPPKGAAATAAPAAIPPLPAKISTREEGHTLKPGYFLDGVSQ